MASRSRRHNVAINIVTYFLPLASSIAEELLPRHAELIRTAIVSIIASSSRVPRPLLRVARSRRLPG